MSMRHHPTKIKTQKKIYEKNEVGKSLITEEQFINDSSNLIKINKKNKIISI